MRRLGSPSSTSRGSRRLLAVAFVVAGLLSTTVPPASAHGTCTPEWYPGTISAATHSYVASWYTPDYTQIQAQTRFFCDGGETHDRVYVHVELWRCVAHQPGHCDRGASATRIAQATRDCTSPCNDANVARTVSAPCVAGSHYLYWAEGSFAAWNQSKTRVHQSMHYPKMTDETELAGEISGGAEIC